VNDAINRLKYVTNYLIINQTFAIDKSLMKEGATKIIKLK
jgi:hypothetical protein